MSILVGFQDPNSVAIKDFYDPSFKINYLALFMREHVKPVVKQEFYLTVEDWMSTLEDRDEHSGRLLPYLISGLFEKDLATAESVVESLNQLGIIIEREKEATFRKLKQTGVDSLWTMGSRAGHPSYPFPFVNRPRLGTRFLVQNQVSKILPAILRELRESINFVNRLKALKLLKFLIFISEDSICEHFHKILPAVIKNCKSKLNENDPQIDAEIFQLVRYMSRFCTFKDLHFLIFSNFDQSNAGRDYSPSKMTSSSEESDDEEDPNLGRDALKTDTLPDLSKFFFICRAVIRGFFEIALESKDGSLDLDSKFFAFNYVLKVFGCSKNLDIISDYEEIFEFSFLCFELTQIWFSLNKESLGILKACNQSPKFVFSEPAGQFVANEVQASLLTQFEAEINTIFLFSLSQQHYFWTEHLSNHLNVMELFRVPKITSKPKLLMTFLSSISENKSTLGLESTQKQWPISFENYQKIQKYLKGLIVPLESKRQSDDSSITNFEFRKELFESQLFLTHLTKQSLLTRINKYLKKKALFVQVEKTKSKGYHLTIFEARKIMQIFNFCVSSKCNQDIFEKIVLLLKQLIYLGKHYQLGYKLNNLFLKCFFKVFSHLDFNVLEESLAFDIKYQDLLLEYFSSEFSSLNNFDKNFIQKIEMFFELSAFQLKLLKEKKIHKTCVLGLFEMILQFSEFATHKNPEIASHLPQLTEYIDFIFAQGRYYYIEKKYQLIVRKSFKKLRNVKFD